MTPGAGERGRASTTTAAAGYLPAARRCQRVRFSIFLCFFFRMRLRRFLMRDPMRPSNLAAVPAEPPNGSGVSTCQATPALEVV